MTQDLLFHYDYTAARDYCERTCGLVWMPELLVAPDAEAFKMGLTQAQVDVLLRLHLWNVRYLFDTKSYTFAQRCLMALYFLVGWRPKR